MRHILVMAILIAASISGLSQPTRSGADQKGNDEKAVRHLVDELYAALGHNDAAALEQIYADDYTLVNERGVMTTKAPRLASIKSGELKYESASYDDLKVRLYGHTAVLTYRATFKAQFKGEEIGGQSRATLTLVKKKAGWQVVAAHVTHIAGQ
jgi:ketosteroid isomerase-like protein